MATRLTSSRATNWTAWTNVDAAGRTVALLEEVWRRNDVHRIHIERHSVHEYPGENIADGCMTGA
jgi:hypothetical protein